MKSLLKKFKKEGIIKEGDFELKGGERSNIYFDIKKAYGKPDLFREIVSEVSKLIPKETTCIAASGHGGIPLATALSLKLDKKLSIVRDVLKEHGTRQNVDGYIPDSSDNVVVVDDVLTSGTSLRNTIENLGNVNILKCLVVLKRGEPKQVSCPIEHLISSNSAQ